MGRFLLAKAVIDGETRYSVIPESGLPHMPQWTAVDASDVREQPWDFEQPEDDASPDVAAPDPDAADPDEPDDDMPAGNASAADWRAYAETRDLPDPELYTRDELRDHFTDNTPLPSKEH